MITAIVLLSILLAIIMIINLILDSNKAGYRYISLILIVFLTTVLTAAALDLANKDKPKAIDVYRGNTELRYNYQVTGNDTIITDSVVVFKENQL